MGPLQTPVRAFAGGYQDTFVAKIDSSNGILLWNTFLGGTGTDGSSGITIDENQNIYVAGYSNGSGWGAPNRPFQGGSTDSDAYVAKLTPSGTLIWNTFLGGTDGDAGRGISVDSNGNVFAGGLSDQTWGTPIRAHQGSKDGFVVKLDTSGNLLWNTFLGSAGNDWDTDTAVDWAGNVYVTGYSFQTWGSPVEAFHGSSDVFVTALDTDGNIFWSTFIGGVSSDQNSLVTVAGNGDIYVTGDSSASWGQPINPYTSSDVFVAKLTSLVGTPTPTPTPTNPPAPTPPPASVFSNASFTYNGDGQRVKSVMTTDLGTTTTYFVGANYEVVDDGTTQTITKYYYAGAQRIAMRNNGTLFFLLGDHLGSTSLTTFANGNVVSETRYTAWGDVRYSSAYTPTDYTYTGQYSYTADFGLMFYNARWYDSSLGRFAQADSIIPEQSQGVQAWDRYAYTNNNPIRYNDPSGHMVWEGEGGDLAEGEAEYYEQRNNALKCQSGNDTYCSYAELHPVETVTFTLTALVAAPAAEYYVLQGGAAAAMDAVYARAILSCLQSTVCRTLTGMAGGAGAGSQNIPDNAFVKYDPISSDKSIGENGLLTSYSGGRTWLTQFKYIKDVANPANLETILYRKSLWADPDVAGRFANGATLRMVNVTNTIPAGVTNMTNGIPQWYITHDVSPEALQVIWRLLP